MNSSDHQFSSDGTDYYSKMGICVFVMIVVSVIGTVTNVINCVVYYKHGMKDSVTVSYFALSLWDCALCVVTALLSVCYVSEHFFPIPAVNLKDFHYVYLGFLRSLLRGLITSVTCYLSVEICTCVLNPFKVRSLFTKNRAIFVNIAFVVVWTSSFCPVWATRGLHFNYDPTFNSTRLILWVGKEAHDVDVYISIFDGLSIRFISQVFSLVTTVILISSLRQSTKFRQKALSVHKGGHHGQRLNHKSCDKPGSNEPKTKPMDYKYTKLAKVFLWINIKHLICNLPSVLMNFAKASVPELDFNKKYSYIYETGFMIVYFTAVIGASISTFVYYFASTKFKSIFMSLFTCNETSEN